MEPIEAIALVQRRLEEEFEGGQYSVLKFKPPSYSAKNNSYVGNILPKQAGHIWSGTWCFYQILIPKVPLAKRGEVNFICYSKNDKCGAGIHSLAIADIIRDFCSRHSDFSHNTLDSDCIAVYKRYPRNSYSEFPLDLAVEDARTLIEDTFEAFNSLRVE